MLKGHLHRKPTPRILRAARAEPWLPYYAEFMAHRIPAVCVHTVLHGELVLAGFYRCTGTVGLFSYDREYLSNPSAYPLDPVHLPLEERVFRTPAGRLYFGMIEDSCAERWGEQILQSLGDSLLTAGLSPIDAIHHRLLISNGLGVGALRYSALPDPPLHVLDPMLSQQQLIRIGSVPELARLSVVIGAVEQGVKVPARCSRYLRPGIAFGGSRPKLLVEAGQFMWVAKFASSTDPYNLPLIEYGINILAARAGIRTTETCIEYLDRGVGTAAVFLSRRFDREIDGAPIHYLSAATLLGAPRTGSRMSSSSGPAGHSYGALAALVRRLSSNPTEDLTELFRRVAFNIMIGNRDDHLCNHGFLKDSAGGRYRLAPAFDLALDPVFSTAHHQQIGVGPQGRRATISNLLLGARDYGLGDDEALEIVRAVASVVEEWPRVMADLQIDAVDVSWMDRVIMTNLDSRIEEAVRGLSAAA